MGELLRGRRGVGVGCRTLLWYGERWERLLGCSIDSEGRAEDWAAWRVRASCCAFTLRYLEALRNRHSLRLPRAAMELSQMACGAPHPLSSRHRQKPYNLNMIFRCLSLWEMRQSHQRQYTLSMGPDYGTLASANRNGTSTASKQLPPTSRWQVLF